MTTERERWSASVLHDGGDDEHLRDAPLPVEDPELEHVPAISDARRVRVAIRIEGAALPAVVGGRAL
jgi:hypothetical protein